MSESLDKKVWGGLFDKLGVSVEEDWDDDEAANDNSNPLPPQDFEEPEFEENRSSAKGFQMLRKYYEDKGEVYTLVSDSAVVAGIPYAFENLICQAKGDLRELGASLSRLGVNIVDSKDPTKWGFSNNEFFLWYQLPSNTLDLVKEGLNRCEYMLKVQKENFWYYVDFEPSYDAKIKVLGKSGIDHLTAQEHLLRASRELFGSNY